MQAQPAASYDGGGFLWEVGTSYNERRFLWGVIRFVWAVTCVRAGQPAFMRTCRIRGVRGFYGQSVRPIMSGGFYEKRYALFGLYLA